MEWNSAAIVGLQALIDLKLSYSEIGKHLGISRSAVAGAIRRHIQHNHDNRKSERTRNSSKINAVTHQGLIEPWAVFHARKKAERAAAKASLSAVALTGQDSD